MAQLLKERARKPLIETAAVVPSVTWIDGQSFYRLDLYPPTDPRHQVLLTRVEMLGVVAEWLKIESRHAEDDARRKAKADAAYQQNVETKS